MFLDTSGLLCFLDREDRRHPAAKAFWACADRWVTHSLVMAELLPLSRSRRMPRDIPIGFLRQVLADPIITLVWVDSEIMHAAVALLLARRDKHYSLCHAVSFLVMRERGLTEALTTDHHFDQEGFQRLLDP